MKEIIYEKLFEHQLKPFLEHLNKDNNDRILFSAMYGMGKTSFLKFHFSQEVLSSIYDVYHIFPVNYVIGSNENIIRYIKYDIVFQMLEKNISINETTKSYLESLPHYLRKNMHKVAAAFIGMIPKVGREIVESYEKLYALVQEFLSVHDGRNPVKGDQLLDFMGQMEAKDGDLLDDGIITNIIIGVLAENKDRKSVLIVDDLDRLDPAHIFRIMNVFAAHFDLQGSVKGDPDKVQMNNKFGFDKVILVCDFENVERLFSHRHGREADFYGYADKYYSSDVFKFDNRIAISSIVRNCLQSGIRNDTCNEKEYGYYNKLLLGDNFLELFLQFLTNTSQINLRNIVRIHAIQVPKNKKLIIGRQRPDLESLPVILQLKILRDVVGQGRRLLTIFECCREKMPPVNYIDQSFAAYLLIIKLHQSELAGDKEDKLVVFNGKTFFIEYDIWESPIPAVIFETQKTSTGKLVKGNACKANPEDFWLALYKATEVLMEIGYLQ